MYSHMGKVVHKEKGIRNNREPSHFQFSLESEILSWSILAMALCPLLVLYHGCDNNDDDATSVVVVHDTYAGVLTVCIVSTLWPAILLKIWVLWVRELLYECVWLIIEHVGCVCDDRRKLQNCCGLLYKHIDNNFSIYFSSLLSILLAYFKEAKPPFLE